MGPPGGGKTTLAMQFPGVLAYDCDGNLDGPERLLRKRNANLSYAYESMRFDDNDKPIGPGQALDRLFDKLTANKGAANVRTVILDGLTHINEFIVRNVLEKQAKTKNPFEMEARDWIPFKSKTYQLLVGKLQGLGVTTICLCHEKILTEQDQQFKERIVGYAPAFQGGVVDYFGGFFTDMWSCECRQAVGGYHYIVQTRKTPKRDLKCSIPDMPAEIDVTNGAEPLLKYLEGKI